MVLRALLTASLLGASSCAAGGPVEEDEARRQPGVEELLGGSLLPGPDEEKLRREHALAGELARTLTELPGVVDARVHLSLADRSLLSRDRKSESTAAVVIRASGPGEPSLGEQVRAIAAAAVPGLAADRVEVFEARSEQAAVETVRVGPIEVAASSAAVARGVLGGLLGVCLLLACGLVYAGLELRRRRRG